MPESYEGQDNHSAMRSSSARGRCLPPFQGVIVFAAFPGVFAALDTPAILCQAFGLKALARGSLFSRILADFGGQVAVHQLNWLPKISGIGSQTRAPQERAILPT